MKKIIYAISILFIALLALQSVSAISTEIKDSYSPSETIITQISGNILTPIVPADVDLVKDGHIKIALDYDVKKLGDNYYLWFIAPLNESNYTLRINNIETTINGKTQEINYEKNFSIAGNLTDYSVKPGFVSTNESFQIKVQLNEDLNKEIETNFLEEGNFTLKPGENTIAFSVSEINESGLYNLTIGKYTLPVYIRLSRLFTLVVGNETEVIDLGNVSVENLSSAEQTAITEERLKHHCSEYPGYLCAASEKCSIAPIVSLDGDCCVNGACIANTSTGGSSAWIGWMIAALVIIAGVIIWIRYKKVKVEKNPVTKKALLPERKLP